MVTTTIVDGDDEEQESQTVGFIEIIGTHTYV